MKSAQRLIVFDLETTGLSPRNGDLVIEIGAVVIEDGNLGDEFQSLIKIDKPVPWGARRVHGISDQMLAGQPPATRIFPEFQRFIGASPLIAHNAAFDLRFLSHEFSQLGLPLENPHHCTLKLSRRHFPQLSSHKLENLAKHLLGPKATENLHLHRAIDDARLTARVWLKMMAEGVV